MSFTYHEKRVILALAGILSLRMLGLFLIFPVFAILAPYTSHATPLLIGLTVGAYGATQACLQIPLGFLSDRYGRKTIILIGLLLLGLGSLVSALSESIYGILLGRVLQGSGAIGCVIMACVIDYTRELVRARSMALIGASIGLSFAVAMVLGPVLSQQVGFGLSGLFWLTAFFSLLGFYFAYRILPNDIPDHQAIVREAFWRVTQDKQLMMLNIGGGILHASLAALFLIIPLWLKVFVTEGGVVWPFYSLSLGVAFLLAFPMIALAEKTGKISLLFKIAALGLVISEGLLLLGRHEMWSLLSSLTVFFMCFSILEASLPSLVAKQAAQKGRGTVLGIYSTMQFLGVFIGGAVGGWLHSHYTDISIVGFCNLLGILWLGSITWVYFKQRYYHVQRCE